MRVLFISSGNKINGISPIVLNQANSLKKIDNVVIEHFTINERGKKGYIKSIFRLRKILKKGEYDLFHAHYSLSGFVASLAGAKPLVVSLMGSDVISKSYYIYLIKLASKIYWDKVFVKSADMKYSLGIKEAIVIPNGVNISVFKPIPKQVALKITKWDQSKKHILFAADPKRKEKNFNLAKDAFARLNIENVELHVLANTPNEHMPLYYNAADIVMLTSLWEGSPNVIKEAMACNRPIISTKVGDVAWLFGDEMGYLLTEYDADDVKNNIEKALAFSDSNKYTHGRQRIIILGIDADSIAKRMILLYKSILKKS